MLLNLGVPRGAYPDKLDTESGTCLVVAGARCVWDDLRPFFGEDYGGKFAGKYDVLCVNDIGMHFPGPVKHLYSNNDAYLNLWRNARRDSLKRRYGEILFTHSNQRGGDVTWPWPGSGTSSLGATYTALALGYDEVILCGIPLDDSGHYFEPPWIMSNFSREVPLKGNGSVKYWQDARDRVFQGKVKSMSGRTAQLLGNP